MAISAKSISKPLLIASTRSPLVWSFAMARSVKFLTALSAMALVALYLSKSEVIFEVFDQLSYVTWGSFLLVIGKGFAGVNIAVIVWRLWLVATYHPTPACKNSSLPSCSVIIPAYNEGKQVYETIRSVAASDYPPQKLQVIAIDDGSVDDTWAWIEYAKRKVKANIITIRLPFNQGKRKALEAGFLKSVGRVFVTVDSDSIVEPQTIRRLVSPIARDSRVGAVAGNVRVLNRKEGIIPRMLDVTFLYSFDFIRASQSRVNTVMCTPGALSAYRRDIVMEVLSEWVNQTFRGIPATIGEDRAMTNLILRAGYSVLFQQNAIVYTNVPVRFENLCRMLLRWARSNVRETIAMSKFAFQPFRTGSALGARINLLLSWAGLTQGQILMVIAFAMVAMHPLVFGLNLLLGVLLASTLPAALYALRVRNTEALWAYAYGVFWLIGLSWITPYSIFTAHHSSWLTRQTQPVRPRLQRAISS